MGKRIYLIFFLIIQCLFNTQAQWVQTNGPISCSVNCFTVSDSIIYAGTSAGVFTSNDKGTNWVQSNSGLPDQNAPIYYPNINAMTILGKNIYLAISGRGVYKSENSGLNWTEAGLSSQPITTLTSNGKNLFAGVYGQGIFVSSDNGETWNPLNADLMTLHVIYLTVIDSSLYACMNDTYLYRSDDWGKRWNSIGLKNLAVYNIFKSGNNLVAGTNHGIYMSSDMGSTWISVTTGFTNSYFSNVSFASIDKILFAGTNAGLFISKDNGLNWSPTGIKGNVFTLATKDSELFIGTYAAGILVSSDNTLTWKPANIGFPYADIHLLSTYDSTIYAGTNSGLYYSSDSGVTWYPVFAGFTDHDIWAFIKIANKLFAGTNFGIYSSEDNGTNWSLQNNGLTNLTIRSLAAIGSKIFAGSYGGGIFCSTDNGSNWFTVNNGLVNQNIFSLLAKGNDLLAGTFGYGMFKSTDNGVSWFKINSYPSSYIFWIDTSNSYLFAGGSSGGVYRSADNGINWITANSGLPKIYNTGDSVIYVLSMCTTSENLFAGVESRGMFLSSDFGNSWYDFNKGLTNPNVTALAANNNFIFAGTSSINADGLNTIASGVWKRPLSDTVTRISTSFNNSPNSFYLEQNYPNPFNPTTSIDYSIPNSCFVTIKVYNVLGKEVKTLVNEYKLAGNYEVKFNADNLTSGIYIYRIETDVFKQSKKMILLK